MSAMIVFSASRAMSLKSASPISSRARAITASM